VSVNEVDADRIGTAGERGTHRVFENEPENNNFQTVLQLTL
jgi:hypothetical protein